MLALIVGTVLAVGALAFVLLPLLTGTVVVPRRISRRAAGAAGVEGEAVAALREIEFDRATGKLSDADYDELKARYTERAVQAIRSSATAGPAAAAATTEAPLDAAEAAVLAYRARIRSCARCGPRPEPDAAYCSNCGNFLDGSCGSCGAPVTEPGATFCTSCGRQLAA